MLILNAFSLSMLDPQRGAELRCTPVSLAEARELARESARVVGGETAYRETPFGPQPYQVGGEWVADSAVGHADTATLFSRLLGVTVPCCRESVRLGADALVGQYTGPRLPEGATTLPVGASIRWWYVYRLGDALTLADPWPGQD